MVQLDVKNTSVGGVGAVLLRREGLLRDARLLAAAVRLADGRNRSRRPLLHVALLRQQHLLLLALLTGAGHHRPLHLPGWKRLIFN